MLDEDWNPRPVPTENFPQIGQQSFRLGPLGGLSSVPRCVLQLALQDSDLLLQALLFAVCQTLVFPPHGSQSPIKIF
jgi:hypothetical protein